MSLLIIMWVPMHIERKGDYLWQLKCIQDSRGGILISVQNPFRADRLIFYNSCEE